MVQNVLRVSIAIDDAFPNRPAFVSLIKEVFMEKAESIMRTKSREQTIFYIDQLALTKITRTEFAETARINSGNNGAREYSKFRSVYGEIMSLVISS